MAKIHVIGGGLAGSEAAWQAAQAGVDVMLHEMRPVKPTDAHHTDGFAELVCSNSFRSDDHEHNAVGLLHEEMRRAGSLIMSCADKCALPAGGALAVDRDGFSSKSPRRSKPIPASPSPRGGCRPAARRMGQCHRGHRPADLACPRRCHPGVDW